MILLIAVFVACFGLVRSLLLLLYLPFVLLRGKTRANPGDVDPLGEAPVKENSRETQRGGERLCLSGAYQI